ncbi:MAG: metallophosphoesterase family protein [Candidatus Hydrogenedentota bacterium]
MSITSRLMLAVCAVCLAFGAMGRAGDGPLDIILSPHNGRPALVRPGAAFEAVLTKETPLKLAGEDGTLTMAVDWEERPDGRYVATCHLPKEIAPGVYALEAEGEGDGERDRNERALHVRDSFPEVYLVAHIADPVVGEGGDLEESLGLFTEIAAEIGEANADVALITGELTANETDEEYAAFLNALEDLSMPAFVCPAPSEESVRYFGPPPFAFWYGEDAYLGFDGTVAPPAPPWEPAESLLYRLRRETKPARWAIGFANRYSQAFPMHSQISLFVDDPLDLLITGPWKMELVDEEGEEMEPALPWGRTPVAITPPASEGAYRFLQVSPAEARPRAPESVVDNDTNESEEDGAP